MRFDAPPRGRSASYQRAPLEVLSKPLAQNRWVKLADPAVANSVGLPAIRVSTAKGAQTPKRRCAGRTPDTESGSFPTEYSSLTLCQQDVLSPVRCPSTIPGFADSTTLLHGFHQFSDASLTRMH